MDPLSLVISRMAPSASAVSRLPFRAQYRSKPPVLPVEEPPKPASLIQQRVMRPLVDGAQLAQLASQPSATDAGGGWWKKLPSTSKLDGGQDKPIPLQMRLWFGMAAVKPIAHVQRGLDACLSVLVGWERETSLVA